MLNKSIDIPIVLMLDEDEPLLYWIVHYKVKRGETVYDVAKKYDCYNNRDNVDEFISDIKKVNKLGNFELKEGQCIMVPLRRYEITVESKED